jgi:mannose-6-phosphate isomerase-like protein (cupin superfamily)
MKHANINDGKAFNSVVRTAEKLQVASMRLSPGKSSGPKGNEHPHGEQVLFVESGEILAEIGQQTALLRSSDCVIVPRATAHRFSNCAALGGVTFDVSDYPLTTRMMGDDRALQCRY